MANNIFSWYPDLVKFCGSVTDPDLLVKGTGPDLDFDPPSLSIVLWFFMTFICEKWCTCSKNLIQDANKNFFMALKKRAELSGAGSVSRRYGSKDPDHYQNVTDPEHCFAVSRTFNFQENASRNSFPANVFTECWRLQLSILRWFFILLRSPRIDSMESTCQPM